MNELKVIQRHFGTIATALDGSSALPFGAKVAAIESWRNAASKIRVFSQPVPMGKGISFAKIATEKPTLKAMLEDHYLGQRSSGVLLLSPPTVQIRPVCLELQGYAESKNMGISWAFYAYDFPPSLPSHFPTVIGLTTPVCKILAQEIPDDIYFDDVFWQEWLYKWIRKYMQAHRHFDATRFGLVAPWPTKPEEEYVSTGFTESMRIPPEVAMLTNDQFLNDQTPAPAPKKRGRKKKAV